MRVPLSYFDGQQHGEVLSRATNDIDNVASSMQQALGQILGALLTVAGVLVMLVVISPLLALITLVTIPLSLTVTTRIAKRAQKGFVAQWKHVGALNGQIEEAFTGHALVKVFGRRGQIETAPPPVRISTTKRASTATRSIRSAGSRPGRNWRPSCPERIRRGHALVPAFAFSFAAALAARACVRAIAWREARHRRSCLRHCMISTGRLNGW